MSAYVISRVAIRDPAAMERYVAEAPATVATFGGRYLVRANAATALEGSWDDDRVVVLEFPTRQAALAWYHSPSTATCETCAGRPPGRPSCWPTASSPT